MKSKQGAPVTRPVPHMAPGNGQIDNERKR
jgi:hypothetical protein